MQSVLPAMALEPEEVIQFSSGRFAESPNRTVQALGHIGVRKQLREIKLPSAFPTHAEVFAAVKAEIEYCRKRGMEPVVNFTGGTKLMSVGAYSAAYTQKSPAIYVETPLQRFFVASEGEKRVQAELVPMLDFPAIARRITPQLLGAMHGCELSLGPDWTNHLPLGRGLADARLRKSIRRSIDVELLQNKGVPKANELEAWLSLWDRSWRCEDPVGDECLKLGYCIRDEQDAERLRLNPLFRRQELVKLCKSFRRDQHWGDADMDRLNLEVYPVQQFINLIAGGGWLEILAAESLSRQPEVTHVSWSVMERGSGHSIAAEHDVLGVMKGRLILVSCKEGRSGKLAAAVSEATHTATRIGGALAKAVLCTLPISNAHQAASINDRLGKEKCQWITIEDLKGGWLQ